eukprot:GEMP01025391.1.p1 GENE.GEMP01025391.1~~GEMP01025391.1.p1  ORF type:complete len:313 (+),score=46.78 GEMP01025391.1:139-1077(+)
MGVPGHAFNALLTLALLTVLMNTSPGLASVFAVCLFTAVLSFTADGVMFMPALLPVRRELLGRLRLGEIVPYVRMILGEKRCCHVPRAPTQLTAKPLSKSQLDIDWRAQFHPTHDYLHFEEFVVEKCGASQKWEQVAVVRDTKMRLDGLEAGKNFAIRVSARNSLGLSAPSNIARGQTYQTPNDMDGGSCEKYTWGQGKMNVDLQVPIKDTIKSKDVKVEVHPTRLSVYVGEEKIVDGHLSQRVKPDDCIWDIETNNQNVKVLNVHLPKYYTCESWSCVVKGEPRIDADAIVYGSKWLGSHKGDLGVSRVCL